MTHREMDYRMPRRPLLSKILDGLIFLAIVIGCLTAIVLALHRQGFKLTP